MEQGLVAQETLIEDRPADFAGYRPKNFDMSYQGDVSVRQALQLSLNVPAVRLLDAVGPARLTARFRQAGVTPRLPPGEAPGLAIGLGGVGVTLRDLVQLYTGLANGGQAKSLRDGTETGRHRASSPAAWCSTRRPPGRSPTSCPASSRRTARRPRGIAYKTGTSYGYRDAWSVGFDGRYVLGVWVGRPDAGAVPGLSGYVSAAPILFEGFARSGLAAVPLPRRAGRRVPRRSARNCRSRWRASRSAPTACSPSAPTEPAPQIVFPPRRRARRSRRRDRQRHRRWC